MSRHHTPSRVPSTAPHFSLEGVGRRWGNIHALREVTLTIAAGEKIAIIGPSGGGKSTLLKLLGGSLRPSTGQMLIDQHRLCALTAHQLRSHRMNCGFVDQDSAMLPHLSVHQNVLTGLLPQWPWWRVLCATLWPLERARIAELLAAVGLAERQWSPAQVLSGGQRQRVAVARALIARPRLFLVDEPTASLDPHTSQDIAQLLFDAANAQNASLCWCTHWFSLVKPFVTRTIGLKEGRIFFDMSTASVTDDLLQALYQDSEEQAT